MDIINNLKIIQNRIDQACAKSGRNPSEVKLLLATKTVSPERIKIALDAGYTLIAENRVQELKEKYNELKNSTHSSHFIGHLQTNKIKDVLKCGVSCIQSVDRYDLAEKLHQKLQSEGKTIDIFIQVNTSGEESKFGVSPENAIELTKKIALLNTLKIKGLMTIGLFSDEMEKVRLCFQTLKRIQLEINELQIENAHISELSMGMSGDLEIAIEEGATIIRVGTDIFGRRL